MNKIDEVYLIDILDAINKIENDEKTIFAVCHALEIISEASNKLSKNFRETNQDFPARQAVEMRNFLIHGYDQIDPKVVWKTVKKHLPSLKKQLQELI